MFVHASSFCSGIFLSALASLPERGWTVSCAASLVPVHFWHAGAFPCAPHSPGVWGRLWCHPHQLCGGHECPATRYGRLSSTLQREGLQQSIDKGNAPCLDARSFASAQAGLSDHRCYLHLPQNSWMDKNNVYKYTDYISEICSNVKNTKSGHEMTFFYLVLFSEVRL